MVYLYSLVSSTRSLFSFSTGVLFLSEGIVVNKQIVLYELDHWAFERSLKKRNTLVMCYFWLFFSPSKINYCSIQNNPIMPNALLYLFPYETLIQVTCLFTVFWTSDFLNESRGKLSFFFLWSSFHWHHLCSYDMQDKSMSEHWLHLSSGVQELNNINNIWACNPTPLPPSSQYPPPTG